MISLITPSAPRPIRAAAKMSGCSTREQCSCEPSAVIIVSARTWVARPPKSAPDPWVPVEIAPATLCRSMSPRFSSARPCSSKRDIEFCDRGASEDSNQPSVVVDVGQPAQPVKAEQQAVGGSNVG